MFGNKILTASVVCLSLLLFGCEALDNKESHTISIDTLEISPQAYSNNGIVSISGVGTASIAVSNEFQVNESEDIELKEVSIDTLTIRIRNSVNDTIEVSSQVIGQKISLEGSTASYSFGLLATHTRASNNPYTIFIESTLSVSGQNSASTNKITISELSIAALNNEIETESLSFLGEPASLDISSDDNGSYTFSLQYLDSNKLPLENEIIKASVVKSDGAIVNILNSENSAVTDKSGLVHFQVSFEGKDRDHLIQILFTKDDLIQLQNITLTKVVPTPILFDFTPAISTVNIVKAGANDKNTFSIVSKVGYSLSPLDPSKEDVTVTILDKGNMTIELLDENGVDIGDTITKRPVDGVSTFDFQFTRLNFGGKETLTLMVKSGEYSTIGTYLFENANTAPVITFESLPSVSESIPLLLDTAKSYRFLLYLTQNDNGVITPLEGFDIKTSFLFTDSLDPATITIASNDITDGQGLDSFTISFPQLANDLVDQTVSILFTHQAGSYIKTFILTAPKS
ncbi:MAG: hypothetical protein HOG49_22450 [Candidatus Scalindua sp.]|nr:hypothetical protein [Candidatus Scalindua sp.]